MRVRPFCKASLFLFGLFARFGPFTRLLFSLPSLVSTEERSEKAERDDHTALPRQAVSLDVCEEKSQVSSDSNLSRNLLYTKKRKGPPLLVSAYAPKVGPGLI